MKGLNGTLCEENNKSQRKASQIERGDMPRCAIISQPTKFTVIVKDREIAVAPPQKKKKFFKSDLTSTQKQQKTARQL